jgi:hypothetical protein
MAERAEGGFRKTPETFVLEAYEIDLSPEDQEAFERDHSTFLKQYLEARGHEVIGVECGFRGRVTTLEVAHVVWPPKQQSRWI